MRQHVQGTHEGGFPCPCREKEKWPRNVQKHQKKKKKKKCTACKEILAKRNLKHIKLEAKLSGGKW